MPNFVNTFPFPKCVRKSSKVGNGWFSCFTAWLAQRMSTHTRTLFPFGTATIGEIHFDGPFQWCPNATILQSFDLLFPLTQLEYGGTVVRSVLSCIVWNINLDSFYLGHLFIGINVIYIFTDFQNSQQYGGIISNQYFSAIFKDIEIRARFLVKYFNFRFETDICWFPLIGDPNLISF